MNNSSQEFNVPVHFWNQITAYFQPNELVINSVERLHEGFVSDNMIGLLVIESEVLDNLERICQTQIKAIKKTKYQVSDIFTRNAFLLAGVVLSSCENSQVSASERKELAVYLGVMGAKRLSGSSRAPKGYKTHRMLNCMRCIYGRTSNTNHRPNVTKSPNDRHPGNEPRAFPTTNDGICLPKEMVQTLKRGTMNWEWTPSGNFVNRVRPFDDRTAEWSEFRNLLLSSPFRNEAMVIWIHSENPMNPKDAPPSSVYREPVLGESITALIAKSTFCTEVTECESGILLAKLRPVKDALAFIFSLYNDPPDFVHESRYPRNCYITTVGIWFKNWQIQIDTFRH